ncbi:MAG: M20/M25/M40 family metallo-hydrolase [Proteobacteria bacterium]|nr:M20/M25/M40 family metallo-hydrolase [Pseudomonadota bacterium]MBU1419724.1 M20/M25/M40 family metallo-hydrolase [Pseudomonadota bacterium]MBU1454161.1 M20/M25/M40 family metallo-hydrolase [Pseudomonadota bacterium]
MPGSSFSGALPPLTLQEEQTSELLRHHVYTLARDIGPRNILQASSLSRTVSYLDEVLTDLGYVVGRQEFSACNVTAVNLEVEIKGRLQPEEIVVVGAHYDTVPGCPGANDNGSGVAALLELARLLADAHPLRTIRLVAFANEEPPFFFSKDMGSRHYAALSRKRREKIVAMLSLETMGYYRDEPGSQHYPFPFSLFYPDTANFIGFVGNIRSHNLVRRTIGSFRRHTRFPSQGLAAPIIIKGVGWSDHWSFWQEGYPAIMVTDTAFFRYAPYHTAADTPEKLDYERLARVVTGLVHTILDLAEQE